MKKLISITFVVIAVLVIAFGSPARAEPDLAVGRSVFNANCVACHKGGANLVMAAKNLQKATLEKYNMASMDAIQYQVKNGKNAMPAFSGRLDDRQIESVAAYVLAQADANWQ
ncbi:cytochrome c6 PetJ [Synechococcus sp. PCC 7336]|uniref:cytochrome c6 PetJ n=1 Tax=Synechococcus sp. PCC 7336 TaxID=195250 RepID=UPI00037B6240|nr:c-type cytochrome [Synechococcus sp. PCC 7336]